MNPIFQAFNSGYSPEEIINFISKAIPQIVPSIKKAQSQGYQTKQILGFLSKTFNSEDRKGMSESARHAANRRSDSEMTKHGLKIVGSAVAAPMIASAAQSALSRALPASVQGLIGQTSSSIPGANNPNAPITPDATHPLNTESAPILQKPQTEIQQSTSQSQQPPVENIGESLPQVTNNQQLPENNLEPVTEQEKALHNIQERQKESARLFDLAREKRPGKEGATPFMRMARELVKKGQINSPEEMDEFRKYWMATEGQRRGSPLVEFENFRSKRVNFGQEAQNSTQELPSMERQGAQLDVSQEAPQGISPKRLREPTDLDLKTEQAKFGVEEPISNIQKIAKTVSYEKPYKDLPPEQAQNFKTIDNAINKTAEFIVSGKDFTDLLASRKGELWSPKNKKGITLSTAEDVLRHLAGVDSKYNLLTPEEQEDAFETFTGLTPNKIWNTISLIDPSIQKIERPVNPKGTKENKKEMTPNDFRRYIGHAVFKTLSVLEKHDGRAKMIISAVDAIDSFRNRKMEKATKEIQEMDDDTLQAMLAAINEEDIKKYR